MADPLKQMMSAEQLRRDTYQRCDRCGTTRSLLHIQRVRIDKCWCDDCASNYAWPRLLETTTRPEDVP